MAKRGRKRKYTEEELKALVDKELSQKEIAAEFGVSLSNVSQRLKEAGLKARSCLAVANTARLKTWEPFVREGKYATAIAIECGLTAAAISAVFKKAF